MDKELSWILYGIIVLQVLCLFLAFLTDYRVTNNAFLLVDFGLACFVMGFLFGGILAENGRIGE